MRHLNKKQIKILDQQTVTIYDDLPNEVIKKLESINFYETLWSDCERYLKDKFFKSHIYIIGGTL